MFHKVTGVTPVTLDVSLYNRGLKLKLIGGPHSKVKMLRGSQLIGEKSYVGHNLLEKL